MNGFVVSSMGGKSREPAGKSQENYLRYLLFSQLAETFCIAHNSPLFENLQLAEIIIQPCRRWPYGGFHLFDNKQRFDNRRFDVVAELEIKRGIEQCQISRFKSFNRISAEIDIFEFRDGCAEAGVAAPYARAADFP